MSEKKEYGADTIKVLEGLEGVRLRPSMYIGNTSKEGLHHLVYEVVDNSVDECLAGVCTLIKIIINKDGSVEVEDNGRGIPVDIHPVYKRSALELVITKLHAGGKFDKKAYMISGGLHGVGISVVAALSKKMIAEVKRDGKIYRQEYIIGKPSTQLKVIGECKKEETGTKITFWADEKIFSTIEFDFGTLANRMRELAFLNGGLKIVLEDERKDKKEEFQFSGGLIEFVKWLNKSKETIHKPVYFKKQTDSTIVEVAVQYNTGYQENIFGFVNTINTVEGGTHIIGFKTALTRVINDYANKQGILKNESLTGDDVREGLTAIISIKIPNPQFEGQTKTKLGNSEIKGIVDSIVSSALTEFFEENPQIAKKIAQKAFESAKARIAASKAKDLVRRKSAFGSSGLPGKLADCSSKKKEKTELYIVEGESAAGCFSADTKVALADGRNLSFLDLVKEHNQGKENFCYTIKNNGNIGIAKIESPRLTQQNVQVIKVVLDNNEEIICTPNHKFMLRNRSYKEAKDLTKEDSLMPFHRRISKIGGRITIEGYEMVWDQKKNFIFTHMLTDEYNLENNVYSKEQGEARHHIDFNKLNNNPTNIIRMGKEEHLILHTEFLSKTMHREDIKEKAKLAHRTSDYRKKMSEWALKPEVNKIISENSKRQWQKPGYKNFMIKKFKEFYNSNEEYRKKNNKILNEQQQRYWKNEENRKKAAEKVKNFFKENPDAREYLSNATKEQWKDEMLLIWRSQKTREQWTPEFREKRKKAYNKTYFNKTIKLMKKVIEENGSLQKFDEIRILNNDKSILSIKTFCQRFFNNDSERMLETIKNYNHKIRKIEVLNEKIDVYDLEVKDTHNFALASGVFVHNSSKQARNKEYQAILPLRGKILNVEKAAPVKVLSSEEIVNLITAIGTGVGEQFNLEKLRYAKIIIMSVDGEEATFVQSPNGKISFVKIGEFIDKLIDKKINPSRYKVLCFSLDSDKTQFKAIKAVIKHPSKEKLYEIKTSYGRNVKVTSSHSVFVLEDKELKLKKGNEIKKGDKVVAPKNLPLHNLNHITKLDILSLFINLKNEMNYDFYVRGKDVEELMKIKVKERHKNNPALIDNRVIISEKFRKLLRKIREDKNLSQRFLCEKLGVKQPCVYYGWEKGKNNPLLKHYKNYLDVLKINEREGLSHVQIVKSKLDNIWDNQYKNSGRNIVKEYVNLKELQAEDLKFLGSDIKICPVHYSNSGINRFVNVDENLVKLIGFWIAEGSCSLRNGIRVSIGNNNVVLIPELSGAFKEIFGIDPKVSKYSNRCAELKLVNKPASMFWKLLFDREIFSSINKKIPDLIFNLNKELQLEFLRGYFLGDGTIGKDGISFTTISKDLANQLMYLLQSFGVVAGMRTKKPLANNKIISKNLAYIINISNREDLIKLKKVWENHKNAFHLDKKIKSNWPIINRKFEVISDDLVGLEVKEVREVQSTMGDVYDFSVDEDENFIAGMGGLCCHNTDADVDGQHIRTLLLTFFFRFLPQLIENGNILIAVSPLYRIRKKSQDVYVYSEEELKKETESSSNVTRFKGLGEMNPQQLWDTTMNPTTRILKKVTIEDAVEADRIFSILMGDDVEPRRQFIIEKAHEAFVDI